MWNQTSTSPDSRRLGNIFSWHKRCFKHHIEAVWGDEQKQRTKVKQHGSRDGGCQPERERAKGR